MSITKSYAFVNLNPPSKAGGIAVDIFSKSLIYETLGALKMAVQLKAVSSQEVCDIEHYLIHDHLNNGPYMTEVYRRWE